MSHEGPSEHTAGHNAESAATSTAEHSAVPYSGIPYSDRALVAAVFDLLIPPDEQPSATQAGVMQWLDSLASTMHAELWRDLLIPGFTALEAEPGDVDAEMLRELEQADERNGWPVPPREFIAALVQLAGHAWYGRRDSPAWDALGYVAAPTRSPGAPVRHTTLTQHGLTDIGSSYDVVIVGAGAGGGVAARVLADSGARVLLLDRGRFLSYAEVGRDHLANHRMSPYGHNTGPEETGNPRVYAPPGEPERVVHKPYESDWRNNAMTVGGGTRVYLGMAWRFHPDDFRMASSYGVPEGSSLVDWPITYDELEPYYTRAEYEMGVCGDGAAHREQGPRSAAYPMPALPDNLEATVFRRGADALGWTTGPVPMLFNSVPRDGRAACVRCGECFGFACPTDAKNGTHNTVIPLALATGMCTLATGIRAERVLVDGSGQATGVVVVDVTTGERREIAAGAVVLSAGAIETARLLLASATDEYPDGLGNRTGHVGRHLQSHLYVAAFGQFDEPVNESAGPGPSIATTDFYHNLGDGVVGGGALYNSGVKPPAMFWPSHLAPDAPRWGAEGKRVMREMYRHTTHLLGPVQEIPAPDARVTLAGGVPDAHDNAVARLSGQLHPESLRTGRALLERAEQWLHASGATRVWSNPPRATLTGGQHQAGTARMGTDPARSVTDPYGQVHGHRGLWVMDGSLHVTNGGVNPVLTILALAYRSAEHLASPAS